MNFKNSRKLLLRFMVAGNSLLDVITDEEILRLLNFLEQTLQLSTIDLSHPDRFVEQLSGCQRHRFNLCINRIECDLNFEAFHELYDLMQNDRINNDDPFIKEEIFALKYLHDQLKESILLQ